MLDPASPLWIPPRLDLRMWSWLWRFIHFSSAAHVRRAIPILKGLQLRSLALYEELCAHGLVFGFRRSGLLSVFTTQRAFQESLSTLDLMEREGIEVEVLDGPAAQAREPLLSQEVVGALYFCQDAHLDPAWLVRELARYAQVLDVQLRIGVAVEVLEREGQRVIARADGNRIAAGTVVLAAGAWSTQLARTAGVRLPILPAKGYSVTLGGVDRLPASPVMLSEARVGVTPLEDGRVRLAGTLELGVWDDSLNARRVQTIRDAAARYLHVHPAGGEVWCGLRPCTPDGLPVVGKPHGLDNLIVASGHGTLGVSLAPVTGELVASLVLGRGKDLPVDPELLSPDRFQELFGIY